MYGKKVLKVLPPTTGKFKWIKKLSCSTDERYYNDVCVCKLDFN